MVKQPFTFDQISITEEGGPAFKYAKLIDQKYIVERSKEQ
jgi:hypothetical protein